MGNVLKFALIGCGRIGNRHAGHIQKHGELVAVCDIDEQKRSDFATRFDASPYASHSEMMAEIDADVIAICTPNGLHFEHTIAALKAEFHVLCEKPMAIRSEHCEQMIAQAEKSNRQLFIVKQNRFNPPVAAVKQLIDSGKLGEILSVQLNCFWNRNAAYYQNTWKGSRNLDGGTLFTQFSHFIDLLYWMVGDVESSQGLAKNSIHKGIVDFEDNGAALLNFVNGAIGTVHYTINSHNQNMEGSLTIFAKNGTVKIGGQYLNELEYQNIADYVIENLPSGNPANNYGQYVGSMSNHGEVYANVVDVLTGEGKIAATGYEGWKTVEIIEKIYKASQLTQL